MNDSTRRAALPLLILAAALAACPARAGGAPDDDGSDWSKFVPPPHNPGTILVPTTSEGGFGAPDRTRLDQQLRHNMLDQFCRAAQIPLDYNFGTGDFSGTGGGVTRYLRADVDNQVALIDDEKLRAAVSVPLTRPLDASGVPYVALTLSGSIEGHSMVVRRTGTTKSCDEIKRLVDLRDIKTVLPASADRISKMALGELWRVPLTLTYSQALSGGAAAPSGVAASVTFGRSDDGTASMTLYRIADDKVRFRFRIDHVVVYSQALGVSFTYPGVVYAADAANILLRFFQREAADQIGHYTAAWLNYGHASSDGKKILMEFIVDPRDPVQAEALSKAVRGDFEDLAKFGGKMSALQTASTLKDYEALRQRDAAMLGDSTYAAVDEYAAKTKTFSFLLPFFVTHNATALFGDDKIERVTDAGGEFHFYRADKSGNNAYFTAPFVGAIVKDNAQRDVEAVTYAPKGGTSGDPIVVYIRNQGYFRETASSVREPLEAINGVLRLAGAQRGGDGRRLVLPVDALVPPSPVTVRSPREEEQGQNGEPADRKGTTSFTLVLNQQAVRDILAAPSQEVLQALAASVDAADKPLMDWLVANGRVDRRNGLTYSWRAAREAFPQDSRDEIRGDQMNDLAALSKQAAALLIDIAAARDAKSNEGRAQALAKLIGGRGEGDLAYEDALRVLVQLVDPMDLSGDFVANVSASTKGVKSANSHLVLKKGRPEVPTLKEAGEAKARFAQPSILVD